MLVNYYEAQLILEERRKDALRKAKQAQLIREARGSRELGEWWRSFMSILECLRAVSTTRRTDESRRQAPTISSAACKECASS